MVISIPDKPAIKIDLLSLKFGERIRVSELDKRLPKILHKLITEKSLKEGKPLKIKLKEMLSVDFSTFYDWINGRISVPLFVLKGLLPLLREDYRTKVIDIINKRALFSAGSVKFTKLPNLMNPQLAYLIGCLHGDGSLHKEYGNITCYSGEKEYLSKVVGPLFKELFGTKFTIKKHNDDLVYRLTISGRAIHSFLANFCPVGKKKDKLKIPKIIKENKALLKWYLSGLFDTDGSFTKIKPSLDSFYNLSFNLTQSSRDFVFDVYEAVKSLGIPVNKPYTMTATHPDNRNIKIKEWRLEAHSKRTLLPLLKEIELLHPDKTKRKQWIIESYNRLS